MMRAIWQVANGRADEYENMRAAQFLQEHPKLTDKLPRAFDQFQRPEKASRVAELALRSGSGPRMQRAWSQKRKSWRHHIGEKNGHGEKRAQLVGTNGKDPQLKHVLARPDGLNRPEPDEPYLRGTSANIYQDLYEQQRAEDAVTNTHFACSGVRHELDGIVHPHDTVNDCDVNLRNSAVRYEHHNLNDSSVSLFSCLSETSHESTFQGTVPDGNGLKPGHSTDEMVPSMASQRSEDDGTIFKLKPATPRMLKRLASARDHVATCMV
ncbi:MAG: hypothetical protein Q9162_007735 [Coniocarpon cinnabarinum]